MGNKHTKSTTGEHDSAQLYTSTDFKSVGVVPESKSTGGAPPSAAATAPLYPPSIAEPALNGAGASILSAASSEPLKDSVCLTASLPDSQPPSHGPQEAKDGHRRDRAEQRGACFNTMLTVDDFELLKVVGKGSFGKVMQVRKKDTGKIYAMKVLKKQHLVARKQVAHTQTERRVLEEIDHPFIVSLRYAFQTPDKLYMILDYFTGGELFFHLKQTGRFSEDRARFYAAQITMALESLHKHNIIYRDLKPENVLLDEDGNIRLTDFGLSKESVSGNILTHTFCGTPEYLAPEVIHGGGYGVAVDWWSLGTLLYEMLTGLPPFYNENLHVMYERIVRAKLTFPPDLSPNARSVLTQLLERQPKLRLGGGEGDAEEVKRHPFFASIDWKKLENKELKPVFRPITVAGPEDVTNVDDEFKQETPKDTPITGSCALKTKINFPDFTYQGKDSSNLPEQD